MYRHLYQLQKECRKSENNIDLTDEIKQFILTNRVYHIPKQSPQQVIINQINNNQQIINFIAKIDPVQKLQAYIEHTNTTILPFEDKVREQYQDQIEMCETIQTQLTNFALDRNHLTNILNDMTSPNGIDKLNVIYDKVNEKLLIFNEGDWESYPFDIGVKELVEKIKYIYLDKYEELLLDKYDHDISFQERKRAEERLTEYYAFLIAFGIKPLLVQGKRKAILDYNDKYYTSVYEKVKKSIAPSQLNETVRTVHNIIKSNCVTSVGELNKRIMDVFCSDQDFKDTIIQML